MSFQKPSEKKIALDCLIFPLYIRKCKRLAQDHTDDQDSGFPDLLSCFVFPGSMLPLPWRIKFKVVGFICKALN